VSGQKKAAKEEIKDKIIKNEKKQQEKVVLDQHDKQLKEIFGIAKAPNRSVEACTVLYFNIHRSLT